MIKRCRSCKWTLEFGHDEDYCEWVLQQMRATIRRHYDFACVFDTCIIDGCPNCLPAEDTSTEILQ
jgi:hypothetical protein